LLEYIYVGRIQPDALKIKFQKNTIQAWRSESDRKEAIKTCMDFINYTDKYDMKEAGLAIYDSLHSIFATYGYSYVRGGLHGWIEAEHIEFFYTMYPAGSMYTLFSNASSSKLSTNCQY
jgi:hypothetical protein